MLNPAIGIINEKIPVYQFFADKKIYSFIWSLHYSTRNNIVYAHLIKKLNPEIFNIPWAKTGRQYLTTNGESDNLRSSYHNYYNWIRTDLYDYIRTKVISENLMRLNIFNEDALKSTFKLIYRNKLFEDSRLMQILLWLTALSIFVEKHNIKYDNAEIINLTDYINGKIRTPLKLINSSIMQSIRGLITN